MKNINGLERRRFVRIPFWFVNKYRVYPRSVGGFKKGLGKNISVGGICFEGEENYSLGTNLEVELDMPALDHAIRVIGQLVWITPKEDSKRFVYGLAFVNIQPNDIAAIKKIVETFG